MNNVTVAYTVTRAGQTFASIDTVIQAPPTPGASGVPLPLPTLASLGLRVVSDATSGGVRTVELAFGPSTAGTATAVLSNAQTLQSVTVTGAGIDYIAPPIISFTGGYVGGANLPTYDSNSIDNNISTYVYPQARAYLNLQDTTIVAPGAGYNSGTVIRFIGGLPPALFLQDQSNTNTFSQIASQPAANGPPYALNAISLVTQGRGYSFATTVQFSGGQLQAGGHPAAAVITSFGPNGEIQAIEITDPGSLYTTVPEISFSDPTNTTTTSASLGTQAKAVALMGAGRPATATVTIPGGVVTVITITDAGSGYVSPPNVLIYDANVAPGSGAVVTARMGVERIDVVSPGRGLQTVPVVVLTPLFKSIFPDTSDQRSPFWNFPLKQSLQSAAATPVVASVPVLS